MRLNLTQYKDVVVTGFSGFSIRKPTQIYRFKIAKIKCEQLHSLVIFIKIYRQVFKAQDWFTWPYASQW